MKKLIFVAIAAVMLSGCTKITMNDSYNENTAEKDMASLVKQGFLTDEDTVMINDYVSSWGVSAEDSLSYESLLSSAKYEKEKEERNKKIQEKLDRAMSVCFVKKEYLYLRGENSIVFDTKVTNNTEENICGYSFHADIRNGSGDKLYGATWTGTDVVKANSSIVTKYRFTYDYDDDDIDDVKKIEAADLDKLQIEYHITAIIYDDGTSLEIED